MQRIISCGKGWSNERERSRLKRQGKGGREMGRRGQENTRGVARDSGSHEEAIRSPGSGVRSGAPLWITVKHLPSSGDNHSADLVSKE